MIEHKGQIFLLHLTHGGVGTGVTANGVPTPGVVGVLRGSRTLLRFFGPASPMASGAKERNIVRYKVESL